MTDEESAGGESTSNDDELEGDNPEGDEIECDDPEGGEIECDDPEGGESPAADDEGERDEDDPPRVVLGRVSEIRSWLSPQLAHRHKERPIWFVLEMDEDFVGVFERIPEGPMPARESSSILAGLREMAAEKSDPLQQWLGPTDSIVFGFHTSATFDEVRKAFEDDGFLVVGTLREGRIVPDVTPEA